MNPGETTTEKLSSRFYARALRGDKMYDVIVIGGGPSGSTAARVSARNGLTTLLVEKEQFPRYKPCGGGIPERIFDICDCSIPPSLCENDIFGVRLECGSERFEQRCDRRIGVLVSRAEFDDYLLQQTAAAGTVVHCEERVTDVVEDGPSVTVRTNKSTYRARFAVIAEGAQGVLKRRVDESARSRDVNGFCLTTEIDSSRSGMTDRRRDVITITLGIVPHGYGWVFPHNGFYSVGIGFFLPGVLKEPKPILRHYLKHSGFPEKIRMRGHAIPRGGLRRRLVSSRLLLTGDAAGFVDPLTGEGIYYAVYSGRTAGEVITSVLDGNGETGHLASYLSLARRRFTRKLWCSRIAADLLYRMPERSFRLAASRNGFFDLLLTAHSMKSNYGSFLSKLFPFYFRSFLAR